MDKIVLQTFASNSRKLSWQKFHDYLGCEFTVHYICRVQIYNYRWIQPLNNKFINAILRGGGVHLTCPDCYVV